MTDAPSVADRPPVPYPISVAVGTGSLLLVAALLGVPNGFNMANQNELYAVAGDEIGAASGLLRTTQYVGANLSAALIEVLVAGRISDRGLHRADWALP